MKNGMPEILTGRRVLVVEDSAIIAMDICEIVTEAGAAVVGPASSIESAERLLESNQIDAAVLDVNLNGEFVDPLARRLQNQSIPFAFLTGYGNDAFVGEFIEIPRLAKPVKREVLLAQLARLFE